MSDPFSPDAVRGAYDTVAADYAVRFGDDLDQLPLDREMIDVAVAAAGDDGDGDGDGWILEAGCGPAPVARHLAGRRHRIVGVDLSFAMLVVAGERQPGLPLTHADVRRLPLRDGSCAVAVAYYSLQHVPRPELGAALAEIARVLRPRGVLLVATHLGEGEAIFDEFLGHRIGQVGGCYHGRDELIGHLSAAGFEVADERRRGPLPHEGPSERLYVIARHAE
jgi:ubiquinone/menaquinone biosynthesis C-methylase UbiE